MTLPCIDKSDLGVTGPGVNRPYMELGEQESLLALVNKVAPAPEVMVEIGVNIGLTARQLLEHQPDQPGLRDAGLLLQPLDGAEQAPIRPFEFQI